jgi:hypothetical protein
MLRDIYVRNPDDPKYIPYKIEENDTIANLIDQLRIMFATSPGEVIAYPDFGVNLEVMLFDLEFDEKQILEEINRQYFQYIFSAFPGINVEFDANVSDGDFTTNLILDVYINSDLAFQIIS